MKSERRRSRAGPGAAEGACEAQQNGRLRLRCSLSDGEIARSGTGSVSVRPKRQDQPVLLVSSGRVVEMVKGLVEQRADVSAEDDTFKTTTLLPR